MAVRGRSELSDRPDLSSGSGARSLAAAVVKTGEMWYNTQKRRRPPARAVLRGAGVPGDYLQTIEERGNYE